MPNTVRISKTVKYLEYAFYITCLCLIIPVKIDHHVVEKNLDYEKYLDQFNKTYDNVTTYQTRLDAYKLSLEEIKQLNQNRTGSSAFYGLTKYSDLSPQDFIKMYLPTNFSNYQSKRKSKIPTLTENFKQLNVPEMVDWRDKHVISKVQNQGNCGACWAFATAEITESMYAIKTGRLHSLSIQEMIDCAENNDGCNGGDVYLLLDWLKTENVTIVTEEDYPTVLVDGKCKKTSSEGIKIRNFECGNFVASEELIIELLANYGPVAVAINALSWQNYVSGVIQFHCDGSRLHLNHAVQIVGYNLTAEVPFYIVRNSWGEDFGDNGYLYIAIGGNVCGLAQEVCIVEL